jgi:prepilin-type N-terminal cleavage/methylation domain-containing protein
MKIFTTNLQSRVRPASPRAAETAGLVAHQRLAPIANYQSPVTHHDSLAFTLLEIMVAISIFALVLTAIYASWTSILRARKVAGDAAASVQRARISIRIIEDSLGSVESFVKNANYYSFVGENGGEGSLSFVARLAKSFPRSGKFGDFDVRRLTFTVEKGSDSSPQLVLRQNPVLMDLDVDEKEHPLVLAKNVQEFQLQFWDMRLNDWTDEWTQTNQIPKLVMVTLKLSDSAYSKQVQEEITRIISIPATAVQPGWQLPMGLPGQNPNQFGTNGPPGNFNTGNPAIGNPGQGKVRLQ